MMAAFSPVKNQAYTISKVMVYYFKVDCDKWKTCPINPKATTKVTQQKVNENKR